MIQRGVGYICGNGNEFFGEEYETILANVENDNIESKRFCVFYSIGKVENVNRTEMMSYKEACRTKDEFIKTKKDLVQIWLYNYEYQEKTIVDYVFEKLESLWPDYKLIKNGFELAIYNKNCFIEKHNDGNHHSRVCILICYMSKDWKRGDGGELIITDKKNNIIEIEPKFGNFVIFNFKEDNLEHEVKKIMSESFIRKSLIQIINEEKI